jgi:hypothetical protein
LQLIEDISIRAIATRTNLLLAGVSPKYLSKSILAKHSPYCERHGIIFALCTDIAARRTSRAALLRGMHIEERNYGENGRES